MSPFACLFLLLFPFSMPCFIPELSPKHRVLVEYMVIWEQFERPEWDIIKLALDSLYVMSKTQGLTVRKESEHGEEATVVNVEYIYGNCYPETITYDIQLEKHYATNITEQVALPYRKGAEFHTNITCTKVTCDVDLAVWCHLNPDTTLIRRRAHFKDEGFFVYSKLYCPSKEDQIALFGNDSSSNGSTIESVTVHPMNLTTANETEENNSKTGEDSLSKD